MSDFFKDIVEEIKDEDTHLAVTGEGSAEFTGWIDTGSYYLNAQLSGSLYGGVPNNKTTAFAGESTTGKTFFVIGVMRFFLEQNPDAGVVYYDTEAAVTKQMLEERGVDTKRVIIAEPQTVQQFRHHALKVIESYEKRKESDRPPLMFILDSLGQLSTTKELEDTSDGKETRDMTKAQIIKATFRVLNLKLAKIRVPLLVTNHVYDAVGSLFPVKEISGGSGLKFTASTILMLTKAKDKDGTEQVGNIITSTAFKSRFTKEQKKVKLRLSYTKGLDRYYGLLDLGEKHGVVKKVANKYEMPDGTKAFEKAIYKNPEKYFTEDVMAALEVAAAKEFLYGDQDDRLWSDTGTEGEDTSRDAATA